MNKALFVCSNKILIKEPVAAFYSYPFHSPFTFMFPFFSFNMTEQFSSKRKHHAETKLDPFYKD